MRSFLTLATLAIPAWGLVVLENIHAIPHGWNQVPPAPAYDNSTMRLSVSLKYRNLDLLDASLAAVSTPCSPMYGQYQDVGDQWAIFAPSNVSNAKVISWLQKNGARNIQSDGVTISFTATVGRTNAMMAADFQVYTKGDDSKLRTTSYSVPEDVAQHIDIITPTTYFDDKPSKRSVEAILDVEPVKGGKRDDLNPSCFAKYVSKRTNTTYDGISPQCLKEMYNAAGYEADPNSGSTVAFANFLSQTPIYQDLFTFEKEFKLPNQSFDVMALLNGANMSQVVTSLENIVEANLDAQLMVGQAGGLEVSTYSTAGSPPLYYDLLLPNASSNTNEPWLDYFNYLLKQPNSNLPYVISHSYGDHENTVPDRYAARVCNEIGMLGLRGRSILFSSGDEGTGSVCRDNRPLGNMTGAPQFTAQFPATCPYVTAVGGTQGYNPSIAWNASSGGFSRYFKQPWYQQAAVQQYFDNELSPETAAYYANNDYVDFTGRAFPDISAHSLYPYYLIHINGTRGMTGGTSAASPVVGGIIALLNDARLRAGLPALGFLNPWLYSSPNILDDITNGTALGCGGINLQTEEPVPGAGIIPFASWNASVGWDPATGLGTPDFQKMKASALQGCPLSA